MPPTSEPKSDNRLLRGQETRRLLMHAAEKLIAEKGIEHVSIREILAEAGQNNSSALQYHFKNLKGLIIAIHKERAEQTRAERTLLLNELLEQDPDPALRSLCDLMVRPAFNLARARADFRRYLKAFGHELILIEDSVLIATLRKGGAGGESGIQLGRLLRKGVPHLSDDTFAQRMEFAVRLCASAMFRQASAKNAFRGQPSDVFIEGLIDAVLGLLTAPESDAFKQTLSS